MKKTVFLTVFLLISFSVYAEDMSGLKYAASYINNYSSCSSGCQANSLSYADESINMFDSELQSIGMTRVYKTSNTHVFSTDLIEDYYHGFDYAMADYVDLYAIVTHGGIHTNTSGQSVYGALCCSTLDTSYSSGLDFDTNKCRAVSNKMIFSEMSNSFNNTYTSNTGKLRWLILATCHSMDSTPSTYWSGRFTYGLDYYMGYRDEMLLGDTTDECLSDFAEDAFGGQSKFKTAWFDANDDWWIDNTVGVFTCGDCSNTTQTASESRRDNFKRTWGKRQILSSCSYYCSWSYHEG